MRGRHLLGQTRQTLDGPHGAARDDGAQQGGEPHAQQAEDHQPLAQRGEGRVDLFQRARDLDRGAGPGRGGLAARILQAALDLEVQPFVAGPGNVD